MRYYIILVLSTLLLLGACVSNKSIMIRVQDKDTRSPVTVQKIKIDELWENTVCEADNTASLVCKKAKPGTYVAEINNYNRLLKKESFSHGKKIETEFTLDVERLLLNITDANTGNEIKTAQIKIKDNDTGELITSFTYGQKQKGVYLAEDYYQVIVEATDYDTFDESIFWSAGNPYYISLNSGVEVSFILLDLDTEDEVTTPSSTIRIVKNDAQQTLVATLDYPRQKSCYLKEMEYSIVVENPDYEIYEGSFDVRESVSWKTSLEPLSPKISFHFFNADDPRIIYNGVTVYLDDQRYVLASDEEIRLAKGGYSLSVRMDDYRYDDGDFFVNGNALSIPIPLGGTSTYSIYFNIYEQGNKSKKLTPDLIKVDGVEVDNPTRLKDGTQSLEVRKSDYVTYKKDFKVTADATVDVPLEPVASTYPVTIYVTDKSGTSLPNATIKVAGKSLRSGETVYLKNGTHPATAKDGSVSGAKTIKVAGKKTSVTIVIGTVPPWQIPGAPNPFTDNANSTKLIQLKNANARYDLTANGKSFHLGPAVPGTPAGPSQIRVVDLCKKLGISTSGKVTIYYQ